MVWYGRYITFILVIYLDFVSAYPYKRYHGPEKFKEDPCGAPGSCNTISERIVKINKNFKAFADENYRRHFRYGDIRVDPQLLPRRFRRNSVNVRHWGKGKDKLIKIPYVIPDGQLAAHLEFNMRRAKEEFKKHTCYRLVERTNEYDYIEIISDTGCWSYVGKRGGRQPLSLTRNCKYLNIILHEFMHVIGFFHEQSRRDRDEYIRVNWTNIEKDDYPQFDMVPYGEGFVHGKAYDINSIMQYSRKSVSVNYNYDSMTPIKQPNARLGVARDSTFTLGDISQLNLKGLCDTNVTVYGGPYT